MKTEDKKQIKDLIDALQMLGFKRKDDKEFLPIFIDRAICNPFKLSYISKNKFEELKENIHIDKEEREQIRSEKITEEIRNKYFKATNIEKFFNLYFDVNTDEGTNLFNNIINKFKVKFFGGQKFRMKTFEGQEIGKIYAGDNDKFKVLACGSCMQAPYNDVQTYWFDLYTTADVKLICLYQGRLLFQGRYFGKIRKTILFILIEFIYVMNSTKKPSRKYKLIYMIKFVKS